MNNKEYGDIREAFELAMRSEKIYAAVINRILVTVDDAVDNHMEEEESKCPACGEYISYCQGHGEIGDPYGHQILEQHDNDNHSMCHELTCGDRQAEEAFEKKFERD